MTGTEILADLASRGVEVHPEGDRLRLRPSSRVGEDILTTVRAHKDELLGLLRRDAVGQALGPAERPGTLTEAELAAMPLSKFAEAGLVVEVYSEVLGEIVLFASDNAQVDPGEQRPVYRASELLAMAGLPQESTAVLWDIHQVKRKFRGTVLG